MMNTRSWSWTAWTAAPLVAACALTAAGCTSKDTRAQEQATMALTAYNLGRYDQARGYIRQAVQLRDDSSDNWQLFARIAIAQNDYPAAMQAYRSVLSLDRANLDAMSNLCRLAIALGATSQVGDYADQLLLINADDPVGLLTKGNIALGSGDNVGAIGYADRLLKLNAQDAGATVLKAQAMLQKGDLRQAAGLYEASLKVGGDPGSRLRTLSDIYRRLLDRPAYVGVAQRLAAASPDDLGVQLRFADLLYQQGDAAPARDLVLGQMRRRGGDPAAARAVLDLLQRAGTGALDLPTLAEQAQPLSVPMRGTLARYALDQRRPDIAQAVLGAGIGDAPFIDANLDAKAALALTTAAQGDRVRARALVAQVLAADSKRPAGLLARARLELADGTRDAAITDTRRVLADDGDNIEARMLLADALLAKNETLLAENDLREGIEAAPDDPRIPTRLARMRIADGSPDEAGRILQALLDAAPLDLRVEALRRQLCPTIGAACGTIAHPQATSPIE